MKQILDYLKIEKLGAALLPPFEKFEGLMAAKVSRRNSESFVVAKWNDDFFTPDVAFDPNANFGMVDEFLELYDNEEVDEELGGEDIEIDLLIVPEEDKPEEPKEVFPIFEALGGAQLSEWLLAHSISHKSTLSKPEKVKLCEKYVADLAKSE